MTEARDWQRYCDVETVQAIGFMVKVTNVDTGEVIERCMECDVDKGYAIRQTVNEHGTPFLNAAGDGLHFTRVYGNFKIERVDDD